MSHWSSLSERGSILGLRLVVGFFRLFGERAARVLLYPVVAYFLVTASAARRASNEYFEHLRRFAGTTVPLPAPGWRTAFRHMMAFAESSLHKFAAWFGQIGEEKVAFPNQAEFQALLASGRGALFIGAHLGNLELTRALASGGRKAAVNAVVYVEHGRGFFDALAKTHPDFSVNLIHVAEVGPGTSIELKEKIDNGELLVIVGDRTPPAERGRTCTVDFLGAPAPFAKGPFILAAVLECPVYLFFCLKEADGYRIHFERFAERVVLPRGEREARLQELAQRYARRLEAYCLRAPYQWFNFYDYWEEGGERKAA